MKSLCIKKLDSRAALPTRAHESDAGLDLYALESASLVGHGKAQVRTGIAVEITPGFVGLVADRSSLAVQGLKTAGGVIDAGYRGEIQVVLWNLSSQTQVLEAGERVAQLLILPIATPKPMEAQALAASGRGNKGFGSSGK